MTAQKLIVDCIHKLINAEDISHSVKSLLHTILEYYSGDRAYIFKIDNHRKIIVNTFEECAGGIEPQIGNLQAVPIDTIDTWIKAFHSKSSILIESVDDLPEDRRSEYEILKPQNIRNLIVVPYLVDGKLDGFLGVDNPRVNSTDAYFLENMTYFITSEIRAHQMRDRLTELSYTDSLTGLNNRNAYTRAVERYNRVKTKDFGVCFCDINGLKKMNDTYGHAYGDTVICYVAEELRKIFTGHHVFRISGDEFVCLCPKTSREDFDHLIARAANVFAENGSAVVAIGSVWSPYVTDVEQEVGNADAIMYVRKNEFYANAQDVFSEKADTQHRLANSILEKEFFIVLQPKFDIGARCLTGAEALVRCREADGRVVSPAKFIPLLEREGRISVIDYFVFKETCRVLSEWRYKYGIAPVVSMNFSKITIFEEDFLTRITAMAEEFGIDPGQLELEVTETQASYDKLHVREILSWAKAMGFRLALDDFGSGFSSYGFLSHTIFDTMKLDKSLLEGVITNDRSKSVIESMTVLGHRLGAHVVMEGVETQEEMNLVTRFGVDEVQGYYISRPVETEYFEELYVKPMAERKNAH